MGMSLILDCINEARNRSDCEIFEIESTEIKHNYIVLNPEVHEFYQNVGGILYGKQEFDGRQVWLWRILKPSEVLPLIECRNDFGFSKMQVADSAEYLHLLVESISGSLDVAIMLGGPLNGYSFLVERDTLVYGRDLRVLEQSFSNLLTRISKTSLLPAFDVMCAFRSGYTSALTVCLS
jgi:hypothetical protein